MLAIVWLHAKGCLADLRTYRHASHISPRDALEVYRIPDKPGQLFIGDGRREWRIN